jgi:hypothetical protein
MRTRLSGLLLRLMLLLFLIESLNYSGILLKYGVICLFLKRGLLFRLLLLHPVLLLLLLLLLHLLLRLPLLLLLPRLRPFASDSL